MPELRLEKTRGAYLPCFDEVCWCGKRFAHYPGVYENGEIYLIMYDQWFCSRAHYEQWMRESVRCH